MKLGTASINITPRPGIELGGYAARIQPSIAILDPLFVKALYLEDGTEKLLWVHADVIALTGEFVSHFRKWAQDELKLPPHQVLLTATHTHAAPVTVPLTGCGQMDQDFIKHLLSSFQGASRNAMSRLEDVSIVVAQAECDLAIDRRNKPSAHTDPIVTAIGFKQGDHFLAAILNYAMHPTALGSNNRAISTDWCGYAADFLSRNLSGNPLTLTTNGACGNINPPKQNVDQPTLKSFGETVAKSVVDKLAVATPSPGLPRAMSRGTPDFGELSRVGEGRGEGRSTLRLAREIIPMPMDTMTAEEIDRIIDDNLTKNVGESWAKPWRDANEKWRETQKKLIATAGAGKTLDIELFAFSFGPITALAINGEIFSKFTDYVRHSLPTAFFTITYANSAFGYIPTREAYPEGGYEVDQAHFFYNTFRPKAGSLEMLAERAVKLVTSLSHR